jgi:hypothetical protein
MVKTKLIIISTINSCCSLNITCTKIGYNAFGRQYIFRNTPYFVYASVPEMVRWVISIGREATMKKIRSTMDILFGYFTHDLCRYRHRVCHRNDEKCVRRNLSHSHRVSRTVVPDIRDERIILRAKVRRSEGGLLRFVERLGQPDHVLHRKRYK